MLPMYRVAEQLGVDRRTVPLLMALAGVTARTQKANPRGRYVTRKDFPKLVAARDRLRAEKTLPTPRALSAAS
jgi:hypothetical protein